MQKIPIKIARNIEMWPTEKLTPYTRNAKIHSDDQVNALAASFVEFGFNSPILISLGSVVGAGHGRLLAAKKLGMTEVPVIVLDHLNETQVRAYRLADNKLAESKWNYDMLEDELAALENEDFDLSLTGFSGYELDDVQDMHGEQPAQAPQAPQPEAPAVHYVQDGCQTTSEKIMSESDTQATIGEFRFSITRSQYLTWLDKLRDDVGYEKKDLVAEIIRRLGL
jgi:hypothetical protein